VSDIAVDVWLCGALVRYGGEAEKGGSGNLRMRLPDRSTLTDLLERLGVPSEERGIIFINGRLSAMPGLQPDLGHVLREGDRVGLFDLKSMWFFQYRHGAILTDEMTCAMDAREDRALHHTYRKR